MKIVKGKIVFTVGMTTGCQTVAVLPRFSIEGFAPETVDTVIQNINATKRLYQDSDVEKRLSELRAQYPGARVILDEGSLVPLDQEAANFLLGQKLPILKERYQVPIRSMTSHQRKTDAILTRPGALRIDFRNHRELREFQS